MQTLRDFRFYRLRPTGDFVKNKIAEAALRLEKSAQRPYV
jgi:hypothetical protein